MPAIVLADSPAALIDSGGDVKAVQARTRHSSAKTTLDVYGQMRPDKDETTRAAIGCDRGAGGVVKPAYTS